ncbi:flavoprotein nadh-dependent oxidoreductase [Moniliophthora roreri]|nr:flavoprotein nadh-dependent oxidoreductase [Moniliophthora roreri]
MLFDIDIVGYVGRHRRLRVEADMMTLDLFRVVSGPSFNGWNRDKVFKDAEDVFRGRIAVEFRGVYFRTRRLNEMENEGRILRSIYTGSCLNH